MKFVQPKLPYTPDALSPYISQTTVEFHYGKHERAYIDKLNELKADTEYEDMPLEEIIKTSSGPLFNNASQAWNHIFYFFQFNPRGQKEPSDRLKLMIEKSFGSVEDFKRKFEDAGASLFGSGWVWLSADDQGTLFITQGSNAANPLTSGLVPLMVFDVWEHAYYLDYQNLRGNYLKNLWHLVDWSVIEARLKEAFPEDEN